MSAEHQHEQEQIIVHSEDGMRYCSACGKNLDKPSDRKAEEVAALMVNSFAEQGHMDGYCRPAENPDGTPDLTDVTIDGHYDLLALARAIVTEVRSDYE